MTVGLTLWINIIIFLWETNLFLKKVMSKMSRHGSGQPEY